MLKMNASIAFATALALLCAISGCAKSGPYPGLPTLKSATQAEDGSGIRVRYLGISSLLISDGETQLLVDGFISRPELRDVLSGDIEPDKAEVDDRLRQIGADKVAAVFVAHAHYDHVLDAGYIAKQRRAKLVGSPSVGRVGEGAGVPPGDIWIPGNGERFVCGQFTVTVLQGPHAKGNFSRGTIGEPLTPPARAKRYRAADSYAFLFENRGRTILVQPSANLPPKPAKGSRTPREPEVPKADVVFMSLGMLGWRGEDFIERYWSTLVDPERTRAVIPIHWDDPTQPLSAGLKPTPFPDRVQRALKIIKKQDRTHLLREMPLIEPVDLDLPTTTAGSDATKTTPVCTRSPSPAAS